jgi:hypothetical protein
LHPGFKQVGENKVEITPGGFTAEYSDPAGRTQLFQQQANGKYVWIPGGSVNPAVAAQPNFQFNTQISNVQTVFGQRNVPNNLNIGFNALGNNLNANPTGFTNAAAASASIRRLSNILRNSGITSGVTITVGTAFANNITWTGGNARALVQARANRVVRLFAANGITVTPVLRFNAAVNITANVATTQQIITGWNITTQAMQRQTLNGAVVPGTVQPVPNTLPAGPFFQRNGGGARPPQVGTYTGTWQ